MNLLGIVLSPFGVVFVIVIGGAMIAGIIVLIHDFYKYPVCPKCKNNLSCKKIKGKITCKIHGVIG